MKRKLGAPTERCSRACSLLLLALLGIASPAVAQTSPAAGPGAKPAEADPELKRWVGDYGPGPDNATYTVAEVRGTLSLASNRGGTWSINHAPVRKSGYAGSKGRAPLAVKFATGPAGARVLYIGSAPYPRLAYGVDDRSVPRIKPVRPLDELRREALSATPPREPGPFRENDLVELAALDRAIHLDIRYATSNDFLGTPVYTQARAFLQRPAAEALLRALHRLQPLGYGLLIHDGYRPWYVSKIFWEATPADGKIFVADPAQGSRHNRGCAVDLTLYDLQTGKPIEMPGTYDEMSPRSYPQYSGGTSLERWHRDLLRWAMEAEGFTVYEYEWWHFDYKDWREYGIANIPFEKLATHEN